MSGTLSLSGKKQSCNCCAAGDPSQCSSLLGPDSSVTFLPDLSHARLRTLLRSSVTASSRNGTSFQKSKTKAIRTCLLSGEQTSTSAAGTANTINSPVSFNSSTFPEVADYAVVYDECRVLGVKLHYYPLVTVGGASATASCAFAIGFDPTVGSPSAPQQVLEEAFSAGPFRLHAGINGGTIQSGDMLHSYRILRAHPLVPLAPITSSDVPGSAWFAVDGGTAPTICQVIGYINSLGTAGVSVVNFFVELEVEFRLRT